MIVFKATQEKILGVLQSMAGIVERRHMLPMPANVHSQKNGQNAQEWFEAYEPNKTARAATKFFRSPIKATQVAATIGSAIRAFSGKFVRKGSAGIRSAIEDFFSASKANLRNAS